MWFDWLWKEPEDIELKKELKLIKQQTDMVLKEKAEMERKSLIEELREVLERRGGVRTYADVVSENR